MTTRPVISVRELVRLLSDHALPICREILPAGVASHTRFTVGSVAGEPGQSLSVFLRGDKPGNWRDFSCADTDPAGRGDILDLIAQVLFRGNKGEAVAWGKRYVGIDDGDHRRMRTLRREAEASAKIANKKSEQERKAYRAAAWKRWGIEASAELEGTPVDLYLRGRGIDIRRAPSTGALRYHAELVVSETGELMPAMVAAIVGPDGKFLACHRTYLDDDGAGGFVKADIDRPKRVLGSSLGGHISLNKGQSGVSLRRAPAGDTVLMCEGIEDGLVLAMAAPELRVIATSSLSMLASVAMPATVTTRIIFKDNDTHPKAIKGFERAVQAHQQQCADVRVAAAPGAKDANAFLQDFGKQGRGAA